MRFEYSKRAVSDIRQIVAYYDHSGNPAVAARIVLPRSRGHGPNYRAAAERPLNRCACLPT